MSVACPIVNGSLFRTSVFEFRGNVMLSKQDRMRHMDDDIAQAIVTQEKLTYKEIAQLFGVGYWRVQEIANTRKLNRPRGANNPAWRLTRDKVSRDE